MTKHLGYEWGSPQQAPKVDGFNLKPERRDELMRYIYLLADAIHLERNEGFVIVWSDESYVNCRHVQRMTWWKPAAGCTRKVEKGKGKRIVIIHAMSKDGLIIGEINGQPVQGVLGPYTLIFDVNISSKYWQDPSAQVATAELIYKVGDKRDSQLKQLQPNHTKDYHDNINGPVKFLYLKNRLVYGFENDHFSVFCL